MKIEKVRATPLAVPYNSPERWVDGVRRGVNNVLVELTTDCGIVGLGEATCGSGNSADPTCAVIEDFAEYLVGEDPRSINRHVNRFYTLARWRLWRAFTNTALAAIEMALWDILGKTVGKPLHSLLGGQLRDRIPAFGFVFHGPPDAMAEDAKKMVQDGFTVIYFAVGLDPEADETRVRAVREAVGPAVRLRVDANESWCRATAVKMIERLSSYDLDFVEQPLPGGDVEGLADLRRRISVPIAANQSCWTLDDVNRVVNLDAADVVVTSLHWLGGLLAMRRCEALCRAANISLVRHSSGELGVAAAAGCHLFSTFPNIDPGNQTLFSHWQQDIVKDQAMALVEGKQLVPTGPGLGIELDHIVVSDFAERYRIDGPFRTNINSSI